MRYMMMVRMDESMPAGPPPPSLFAAIGELGEQARKDGALLEEGGLLPSAAGALVRLSGGQVSVIDGPFTEAKELVAGYWIFQCKSLEECIEWVRRSPNPDPSGADAELEIRQVFEMTDFPELPPEVKAQEEAFLSSRPK